MKIAGLVLLGTLVAVAAGFVIWLTWMNRNGGRCQVEQVMVTSLPPCHDTPAWMRPRRSTT